MFFGNLLEREIARREVMKGREKKNIVELHGLLEYKRCSFFHSMVF
jgi:hypothetical protein